MYKYYTKQFTDPKKIDEWLNSFKRVVVFESKEKPIPIGEYNYEIVGYVAESLYITITIRVFENKKDKLLKGMLKDVQKNGKEN